MSDFKPTVCVVDVARLHAALRRKKLPAPHGDPTETRNLVYALLEPDSDAVRYVGLSSVGLTRPRQHGLVSHIVAMQDDAKARWILGLWRRRKSYRIAILVWGVRTRDLSTVERIAIDFYRKAGADLLNKRRGGNSPPITKGPAERAAERERRLAKKAEAARIDAILSRPCRTPEENLYGKGLYREPVALRHERAMRARQEA